MIGRTIGNYTILDKLGSGGMGEVYLAQHARIDRRAAIKFLLPGLSKDAEVVERFFNEARATSVIRHAGIVEIYDCDVIDDRAYIVMEYLEGESLAELVARAGSFAGEPMTVAAVAGRIASALGAGQLFRHAANGADRVGHRDPIGIGQCEIGRVEAAGDDLAAKIGGMIAHALFIGKAIHLDSKRQPPALVVQTLHIGQRDQHAQRAIVPPGVAHRVEV